MLRFLKRILKPQRESFDLFLWNRVREDPSLSLEDVLSEYIKKYKLAVRHSLDEPTTITGFRTRLHILEESILANPKYCPYDQLQHYVESLRRMVNAMNELSPEVLKRLKDKE